MRTALSTALLLALLVPCQRAQAEGIYRYVDRDGFTVFTNIPRGGAKRAQPRAAPEGGQPSEAAALEAKPDRDEQKYDAHIAEACTLYRIPEALVRAIVAAESNFDPQAVSARGAKGLMQLMPETASAMFVADVFDPKQNILGGVRYLRILANMFDGDMVQIVAAYNAGPEAVRRARGIPLIAETQEYVKRVLRLYFAYKSES